MSRQLEEVRETKRAKLDALLLLAVDGELEASVLHSGGVLRGMSLRFDGLECLATLRATVAGKPQICFVGSEDLGGVLRKVVREGYRDGLRWRDDAYGKGPIDNG
jgi:hypothetical protein